MYNLIKKNYNYFLSLFVIPETCKGCWWCTSFRGGKWGFI